MSDDLIGRIYGVDCPDGEGHVIRLAKALLPSAATVKDLRNYVAEKEGLKVSELCNAWREEFCEVHNLTVHISLDQVRFVEDSENPVYQPDMVHF
jgi:hypothetical protein